MSSAKVTLCRPWRVLQIECSKPCHHNFEVKANHILNNLVAVFKSEIYGSMTYEEQILRNKLYLQNPTLLSFLKEMIWNVHYFTIPGVIRRIYHSLLRIQVVNKKQLFPFLTLFLHSFT